MTSQLVPTACSRLEKDFTSFLRFLQRGRKYIFGEHLSYSMHCLNVDARNVSREHLAVMDTTNLFRPTQVHFQEVIRYIWCVHNVLYRLQSVRHTLSHRKDGTFQRQATLSSMIDLQNFLHLYFCTFLMFVPSIAFRNHFIEEKCSLFAPYDLEETSSDLRLQRTQWCFWKILASKSKGLTLSLCSIPRIHTIGHLRALEFDTHISSIFAIIEYWITACIQEAAAQQHF